MLTIAMGICLRLSKADNSDVPFALLIFCAMLADFATMLLVVAMLIDTGTLQNLAAILGSCG